MANYIINFVKDKIKKLNNNEYINILFHGSEPSLNINGANSYDTCIKNVLLFKKSGNIPRIRMAISRKFFGWNILASSY